MNVSQAKHAFITGGASGIGLAIADALAAKGVPVTIADIDPDAIKSALASRPKGYRGQVLDTRDRAAWAAAKAESEAAFGPVDILVNNAGIAPNGQQFADMDPESFDRIIAINLTGVFNGVHAFASDMRTRKHGHIVNTSSTAGITLGFPTVGAYATAKFGVMAISETLRREMAPHNVGVSVLCPGMVKTNLARSTAKVIGDTSKDPGEMPDSATPPAQVADVVIDAITRNLAYAISHPQHWDEVEKRNNKLKEAFDDALKRPA